MIKDSEGFIRKKIATALGEVESAEPIHNIKVDGQRLYVSLGRGEEERRFSFQMRDEDWEFSGEEV
jgi:hypothetical protein